MNTVGIFAGRGDVILAMLSASILSFYLGWLARKWFTKLTSNITSKFKK